MKPCFYLVITGADTWRFNHRATARAFCAACKLAGNSAIVKAML